MRISAVLVFSRLYQARTRHRHVTQRKTQMLGLPGLAPPASSSGQHSGPFTQTHTKPGSSRLGCRPDTHPMPWQCRKALLCLNMKAHLSLFLPSSSASPRPTKEALGQLDEWMHSTV